MRRLAALTLCLALPAAGCSPGDGNDAAAAASAAVMARVDAAIGEQTPLDPGEVVVPEGCRLAIETDEYGFETEFVVCDDEPPATTTTSGEAPPGGEEPATSTIVTTSTVPAELSTWGGSEDARNVARNLRRVLVEQTGCHSPQDLIALENLAATSPAEIRSPLQAAVADLKRSADLCNVDVIGWHQALGAALDDLEDVIAVFEEAGNE